MTLRELVEKLGTVEVELGGERFKARIIGSLDADMIARLHPRPDPPMVVDGTRGSLAAKVPNFDDPAFVAAGEAWFVGHMIAVVSAALNGPDVGVSCKWPELTIENHATLAAREQAQNYLAETRPIVAALSYPALRQAFGKVTNLPTVEDAVKN